MKPGPLKKLKSIMSSIFSNKTICIIGIDGAGKSSVANELKQILQEDTAVQYMGHRENKADIKFRRNKILYGFSVCIAHLFEVWYNVVRHWPGGHIVIYDRYAWDRYISKQGLTRIITKILFRFLFPKPKYVFYLYCSLHKSLDRKDDILDPLQFSALKAQYDKEFLNIKSIVAINTTMNSINQTIDIISSYLPQKYFNRLSSNLSILHETRYNHSQEEPKHPGVVQ